MRAPTRRHALVRGLAGVGFLAVGGLTWRAWDTGVFSVGKGPAYEPWHRWQDGTGAMGLVQAGILAASPHNTQPWRFRIENDTITLHVDLDRHLGSFDPFRREMHLGLGCALENLAQAARAQGQEPRVELVPGQLLVNQSATAAEPVAVVRFAQAERAETELYRAIPHRHTHRGAYLVERSVSEPMLNEMQALVPATGSMRLFVFTGHDKRALSELIVSATQAIISDPQMAADSARWFRFSRHAVERHRDGLTLDAAIVPPIRNAVVKMLPPVSSERADRQWLDDTRDTHVATTPLLGVIGVRDLYDRPTSLLAGRLWQRIHLWLTARGLVAQPLNQPVEMVDRERELNAPVRTAQALARITGEPQWYPTFIFRAGYADRPARLSPRRPARAVVSE
jgi:hypothetical protein